MEAIRNVEYYFELYLSGLEDEERSALERELGLSALSEGVTLNDLMEQDEVLREKVMEILFREAYQAKAYLRHKEKFAERNKALKAAVLREERRNKWLWRLGIALVLSITTAIIIYKMEDAKDNELKSQKIQYATKEFNILSDSLLNTINITDILKASSIKEVETEVERLQKAAPQPPITQHWLKDRKLSGANRNASSPKNHTKNVVSDEQRSAKIRELNQQIQDLLSQQKQFSALKNALEKAKEAFKSKQYASTRDALKTFETDKEWATSIQYLMLLVCVTENNGDPNNCKALIEGIQKQSRNPYKARLDTLGAMKK